MTAARHVYVVDDDDVLRGSLVELFRAAGCDVHGFASAEAFLAVAKRSPPGCVVADLRLPRMSGLEMLRALTTADMALRVVVITGHGDVPMAVKAIREGAVDFFEKPFDVRALLEAVDRGHAELDAYREQLARRQETRRRHATLTGREAEMFALLVEGHPTKVAAMKLGISPRTAETHRARVMEKMGARSLSELVRQALTIERAPLT